jgi:osmotically-inducible protein OsmY
MEITMRRYSAALGFVLVLGLTSCSSSDREKAREEAREDARKAGEEAKKAGKAIEQGATDLSHKVDAAVQQPSGATTDEKLAAAREKASVAADRASVKIDHATLLAKVKTKLASDAGLSTLAHVIVTLNAGEVTLSGTVASDAQKKAAEMAASQVDGVTRVHNRLTIRP